MDATDLLLDDNGDLLIVDDDNIIDASDDQHIQDILVAYPGEYKQFPLLGVYIQRISNGLMDGGVRKDIKLNLQSDGYEVGAIKFLDKELDINAKRTS